MHEDKHEKTNTYDCMHIFIHIYHIHQSHKSTKQRIGKQKQKTKKKERKLQEFMYIYILNIEVSPKWHETQKKLKM
jgi:hypothetical protein